MTSKDLSFSPMTRQANKVGENKRREEKGRKRKFVWLRAIGQNNCKRCTKVHCKLSSTGVQSWIANVAVKHWRPLSLTEDTTVVVVVVVVVGQETGERKDQSAVAEVVKVEVTTVVVRHCLWWRIIAATEGDDIESDQTRIGLTPDASCFTLCSTVCSSTTNRGQFVVHSFTLLSPQLEAHYYNCCDRGIMWSCPTSKRSNLGCISLCQSILVAPLHRTWLLVISGTSIDGITVSSTVPSSADHLGAPEAGLEDKKRFRFLEFDYLHLYTSLFLVNLKLDFPVYPLAIGLWRCSWKFLMIYLILGIRFYSLFY